jgi:agmatinase
MFNGFAQDFDSSEVVLFGSPFDGTASYRAGSRFAPMEIRNISESLETYSPYLQLDLQDYSLHDAGDLPLYAAANDVENILDKIEAFASHIATQGKKPLMLGGDHLTTLPSIRAVFRSYPDLCVIQLDAHTDLADKFMGDALSHASVMRRVWDFLGDKRIFQLGIRSGPGEEFRWAEGRTYLYPFNLKKINSVVEAVGGRPVYLTVDLDVLDPSVAPGTGTPEPGGVFFHELLETLMACRSLNIVAADLVELAPHYDHSGASTVAAAKLVREIAGLMVI